TDRNDSNAHRSLADVEWVIRLSGSGTRVDPQTPLAAPPKGGPMHDWVLEESSAAEGVALSLRHSTPGRIGPYMHRREQLSRKREPVNGALINVPTIGAH